MLYRDFSRFELANAIADMLITEPVVFSFSIWVAFCWAVLYLQFSALPLVFKTNHKFNIEESGAVFTCKNPSATLHRGTTN